MSRFYFFSAFYLVVGISFLAKAQLSYTGFEGIADESAFTRNTGTSSWVGQGFTVPWVDGFNTGKAYIDNAYSKAGTNSLRLFYPTGQFGPANTGGQAPLMLTPASQYYMSYWLRFSDNFSWGTTSEGGKLPGLAGGARCSGCANCTGSNGFTARLMWRPGGRLVLYLYHLDKTNPPCGDNLTLKSGGLDYYAPKGQWIQITQRVKVNTGTNHDGEVELWVNEQPALLVTGIQFVSNGDQVDNLYFSTFHGGSDAGWAPTVDCYTWFDELKISTNPGDVFSSLPLETVKSQPKESLDGTEEISFFPQPVRSGDVLWVDKLSHKGNCRLEWINASGATMYDQMLSEVNGRLNVPELSKGMYVLKMIFSTEVVTRKIVVE